jgi:hypothetical protein
MYLRSPFNWRWQVRPDLKNVAGNWSNHVKNSLKREKEKNKPAMFMAISVPSRCQTP